MSISTIPLKIGGRFCIQVLRADGSVKQSEEFDNLVLDSGIDYFINSVHRIDAATTLYVCKVGTSNVPPSPTDTSLGAGIARQQLNTFTAPYVLPTTVQTGATPYYVERKTQYDFALGAVVGNISEVGISNNNNTDNSSVHIKSLIKDSGGTPVTITVLATESLRVFYTLRLYMPETDVTGNVTINSINYTYTIRPTLSGASNNFNEFPGTGGNPAGQNVFRVISSPNIAASNWLLYTSSNVLTSVTGAHDITGGSGGLPNSGSGVVVTIAPYVAGSFYRQASYRIVATAANIAGGLGKLIYGQCMGVYQIVFSPKIPKTDLNSFEFTFRIAIANI